MALIWRCWQSTQEQWALEQYCAQREWAHLYLAALVYKAIQKPLLQRHFLLGFNSQEQLSMILAMDGERRFLVDRNTPSDGFLAQVQDVLASWPKPYCLIGNPRAIAELASFYVAKDKLVVVDYNIMTYTYPTNAKLGQAKREEGRSKELLFKRSTASDYERLLELEVGYQREEVMVVQNYEISTLSIGLHFKKRLMQEESYHLEYRGHALTKASINIVGRYYDQVAGVYTHPKLRAKGLGKIFFEHLLFFYATRNKGLTLFVKKHNTPARALYKSLFFEEREDFSIAYL
jgi:GNAT superfamily N-acetyltransferase